MHCCRTLNRRHSFECHEITFQFFVLDVIELRFAFYLAQVTLPGEWPSFRGKKMGEFSLHFYARRRSHNMENTGLLHELAAVFRHHMRSSH